MFEGRLHSQAFSSEPRKLFRYLKLLQGKLPANSFVDTDSEVLHDPVSIAAAFNRFFNSTFTSSDFVLPNVLPTPSSELSSLTITVSDTFEALASLHPDKAMGCDNISPKILKACATSLCEPVAALFNKCLVTGTLPAIHKIIPIPKSGDKSQIVNY